MAVGTTDDADGAGHHEESTAAVTAHSTSGDRTVFTEAGNTDGWIATDHTVELRR